MSIRAPTRSRSAISFGTRAVGTTRSTTLSTSSRRLSARNRRRVGYCLLGPVIEKVSGQTYEHFVKRQILAPIGAYHTALGDVRRTLPGDVNYYPPRPLVHSSYPDVHRLVSPPYAIPLSSFMSDGGLVSTTIDLLRFLTNLNGTRGTRLLAGETSGAGDFNAVPAPGEGWQWGFEGELTGTRT